jgi:hypothetical protein
LQTEYTRLLEASQPHSHPLGGGGGGSAPSADSLELGESPLALQAGSTSVVDGKAASSAKAPVLLGELCILLVSCTMALRNYSQAREPCFDRKTSPKN